MTNVHFSFFKSAMSDLQENDLSVNLLHASTIFNMCKKLNINMPIGGDFKTFAGKIEMPIEDVMLISQQPNPAEEIFKWWWPKKEATVVNLRKILKEMPRDDILEILDKDPKVEAFSKYGN